LVRRLATSEPPLGSVIASAEIFFPEYLRQHLRLNPGAGGARDRRRTDGVAHQARTDPAGAGPRELLRGHDFHELVGGHAAIFFREAQSQQADVSRLCIELARKLTFFVPLMGVRLDLLRHKTAHHLAKGFVFAGVEWAPHSFRSVDSFCQKHDVRKWAA
jgi:hypothetical protein